MKLPVASVKVEKSDEELARVLQVFFCTAFQEINSSLIKLQLSVGTDYVVITRKKRRHLCSNNMPSGVMGESLSRESVHTFSRFSWSVDSACDLEFLDYFPLGRMTLDDIV